MSEDLPWRTALRHEALPLIKAALPDLAEKVYDSPVTPRASQQLPYILIHTPSTRYENVSQEVHMPSFIERQRLQIEVHDTAGGGDDLATRLDEKALTIEAALMSDPDWVNLASHIDLVETTNDTDGEGSQRKAVATVVIEAWRDIDFEPKVEDTLKTLRFEVDVIDPAADPNEQYPGPDGRIEVGGDFDIPQEE